ncbi:N-6 DNA methylase [Mesomycoplasma ovipneumoniae]|uniref:N-6 DNA methylase n=1 Tax=Mesomycoplasma ovipneumoniae TaxID=29562 RepID=UPI003080A22D
MKSNISEVTIASSFNSELRDMGLKFSVEQEPLNIEDIDFVLKNYLSKSGKSGGNRPDCKMLLLDKQGNRYPVFIEYKVGFNKMVKLDPDGYPDLEPNSIKDYAVNGAIHYSRPVREWTFFSDIIVIGAVGDENTNGKLDREVQVWWISNNNYGKGKLIGEYSDFSFLAPERFDKFIEKAKISFLSEKERNKIRRKSEEDMNKALSDLHQYIHKNENNIDQDTRLYLIVASIIASLGIPNKVAPLNKSDLKSSKENGSRDGDLILNKIKNFLDNKNIRDKKEKTLTDILSPSLEDKILNTPENGESKIKKIFGKVVDLIGHFFKNGLEIDFAGKLFNEMYSWLGFSEDKKKDVVLTPPYVAKLLAKLARINQNSYVWDFATGSGGLLVAAMNEMIADATKKNTQSHFELEEKIRKIKAQQILGIEILPKIHMLSILNMIIMGDGSSNLLNKDSLKDFDNEDIGFPANALILNPPYSAPGNGMIFVEKALSMMTNGYAAVIIQSSAGSGRAKNFNKKILKNNTLLASIKMPLDLFKGKSNVSVQTYIYVFQVGQSHNKDHLVKFIDFSKDGYKRRNRNKSKVNLLDEDNGATRYQELVDLVHLNNNEKLKYIDKKCYFTDVIDPLSGSDWNKPRKVSLKPEINDFKNSIGDFLIWEVSEIIKDTEIGRKKQEQIRKIYAPLIKKLKTVQWDKFEVGKLFEKIETKSVTKNKVGDLPATTSTSTNNQIGRYIDRTGATILENVFSATANATGKVFFQPKPFTILQDSYALKFKKPEINKKNVYLFFLASLNKVFQKYNWNNKSSWAKIKEEKIYLPIKNKEIDYDFIEKFSKELQFAHLAELEAIHLAKVEAYLITLGLDQNDFNYKPVTNTHTHTERERESCFSNKNREFIFQYNLHITKILEF